jgi:uncharacterized membrane protein
MGEAASSNLAASTFRFERVRFLGAYIGGLVCPLVAQSQLPGTWLLIAGAAIAAPLAILLPWPVLKLVLAGPFLLFAPGAALLALALPPGAPRSSQPTPMKLARLTLAPRLALACLMSLSLVILVGLLLVATGLGLSAAGFALALSVLTLLLVAAAALRWRRVSPPARAPATRSVAWVAILAVAGVVLLAAATVAWNARPGPPYTTLAVMLPSGDLPPVPTLTNASGVEIVAQVQSQEARATPFLLVETEQPGHVVGHGPVNFTQTGVAQEVARQTLALQPGALLNVTLNAPAPPPGFDAKIIIQLFRASEASPYREASLFVRAPS